MKINLFYSMMLAAALLVYAGCGPKEGASTDQGLQFTLQLILGDVKVVNDKGSAAAAVGQIIALNDTVTTGKGAIADILYGTQGVIRVSENSNIKIAGIADKTDNNTTLNMKEGKVFCTLTKLKKSEFRVQTPTAIAAVRGTSFSVTSGEKGSKFMVANGVVKVNPVKEGAVIENISVDVTKGMKTDLIDEKAVTALTDGKKKFNIVEVTVEEKKEIQSDASGINLELIKNLDISVKKEIQEEVIAAPKEKEKEIEAEKPKKDDRAALRMQKAADLKAKQEEEKLKAEELRKEEEMRIQREEQARIDKIKKEEKTKKDRASNIPSI